MSYLSSPTRLPGSLQSDDYFDQQPVAVLVLDRSGVCTAANEGALGLLAPVMPIGLRQSALFSAWLAPPDLSQTADHGRPAILTTHSDGRRFSCQFAAVPGGGVCLALMDVTTHLDDAQHAARDQLTGLLQRGGLKQRLEQFLAGPDPTRVAVQFIDLDRFKAINDALGHAIGDALLIKVAERLRSLAGADAIVARLGGDEFSVVHGSVSPDEAQAFAARAIDLVARPYVIQGHMLNIGASIGIAFGSEEFRDPDTLLRHADLALYRAKSDGRGTWRLFEPAMNANMQARRALESDLRRALPFRQLSLDFQPLVQLASDQVGGFEALLRWRHPERGLVSPADFIPLAEQIGLIVPIGDWVLRSACREAASWPVPATVAVNISPVQFRTGRLTETVAAALTQSGLAPERLELEITEGALLDETNLVVSTLHTLRGLGVRISMDDFGTGYSSLSYLRKFPFDKIKIDQSFVRGLGDNVDCDAIVRAIARLGASLGMRTTAEGVETADQLDRIRAEGCTEVQGYLTGRPMSPADVLTLLQSQAQR